MSVNAFSAFMEDIEQAVSDKNIPWRDMSEATVFITGVTGLIGSALVSILAFANEKYWLDLRIIGHGRNAAKGDALCKRCEIEFIGSDIRRPIPTETLPQKLDYIFHCAAITKSADMVAKPVEVITTAIDGTRNVLELARDRHCGSFVYLSSMEVYGDVYGEAYGDAYGQTEAREVAETDLGYLDLSNPRSSYPESKRCCELLCAAHASQHGFPVKIARLAQTFGAGTPRNDTRVFAQFARSAAAGNEIELHTEGKSRGNYCYTADAVRGLLTILLKGGDGEAYNVANPEASMTIREMAGLLADAVCGGKIKVKVKTPEDIEKRGYAPDTGFRLNTDKLNALGWTPMYGLSEMYKRMLSDWLER